MRPALLCLSALIVLAKSLFGQTETRDEISRLYASAVAAAETSDFNAAIAQTDSLLQLDPTVLDAWWNLGIWRSALNQPQEALAAWKAYRAIDSTDWKVEAKLVQTYQALGDRPRRDSALAGLLEHRRLTKNPELKSAEAFCREQATIDGHRVMVFQNFAPKGDRMIHVTFHLIDSDGRDTSRYSLGSYDVTTAVAREAKDIGPKDRLYHLDYYFGRNHSTIAFYREPPPYDALRDAVWAAMRGELRPMSTTTVAPP